MCIYFDNLKCLKKKRKKKEGKKNGVILKNTVKTSTFDRPRMPNWTLLFFTLQVYTVVTVPLSYVCHSGTYLHTPRVGPDFCLPCHNEVGYMPESLHRNRQCYNCTQMLDPSVEVLVSACNKTHDSVILCRQGYYRQVARNVRELDRCVLCSVCDHVTRPCQGNHDAVCCLPSYEAVWNKHGFFECKERPIVCGAGEFLSLKTEQCTPCPPGTFMTSDKHNHTNCQVCQTLDDVGPHQEIVQPCNKTHPSQFACQDGFYRTTSLELKEAETNCVPCQMCEFNGGVCHKSHSSSPELECLLTEKTTETTTTKNATGTSVSSPSPVCKENEYLSTQPDINTSTCLPCLDGTHLDDVNHTRLGCKNQTTEVKTEITSPQVILSFTTTMITLSTVMVIFLVYFRVSRPFKNKDCFRVRIDRRITMIVTLVYLFIFVNLSLLLLALSLSSLFKILAWINLAIFEVLFVIIFLVLCPKTNDTNKAFEKDKIYLPKGKTDFYFKVQNKNNKEVEELAKSLNNIIE